MYNQGAQIMNHRRSAHSYRVVSTQSRKREPRQEQVRVLQLIVCLVLFLAIFLWKGVFPHKLGQARDNLLTLITTDLVFREALAGLGESLAKGDTVLADFGTFCMEVFEAGEQDTPAEPISIPTLPPEDLYNKELYFLSQVSDAAACAAHYADWSRYGFVVVPVEAEPPFGLDEAPTDPVMQETPAVIPAVGTVVRFSDYSGEALPNNYTMDQLSLGTLETATPIVGHLNSEYSYRDHPINGKYQFHGGVDIGGQKGDPIGAFAAGTVEYIGEDDSYGQYLQIDHGSGIKSFYAHCSKIVVSKGQTVELGEKVAEVGSSGSATGPHLHLELKYNKLHLNPAYYVEFLEP